MHINYNQSTEIIKNINDEYQYISNRLIIDYITNE